MALPECRFYFRIQYSQPTNTESRPSWVSRQYFSRHPNHLPQPMFCKSRLSFFFSLGIAWPSMQASLHFAGGGPRERTPFAGITIWTNRLGQGFCETNRLAFSAICFFSRDKWGRFSDRSDGLCRSMPQVVGFSAPVLQWSGLAFPRLGISMVGASVYFLVAHVSWCA